MVDVTKVVEGLSLLFAAKDKELMQCLVHGIMHTNKHYQAHSAYNTNGGETIHCVTTYIALQHALCDNTDSYNLHTTYAVLCYNIPCIMTLTALQRTQSELGKLFSKSSFR